jgi:hypothetical protein
MTIYVGNGDAFEANAETGITGLTGTLAVRIDDNDGNTVFGPTTANITEHDTTGLYSWNSAAAPAGLGQYAVVFSTDGTFDEETVLSEDLVVVASAAGPLPPIPPPTEGGLVGGPCTAWITGDDVAACCGVESSSGAEFDNAAEIASRLLFQLSGRQFTGLCGPRTVSPPCDSCYCGYQILSRGYVIGPWDYGYPLLSLCDQCLLACSPSMVKLAGYPIREITQVKIDGDVVDASEYKIFNNRYLVRTDNQRWPVRNDLTLPDTEEHTWSVSYTYGAGIPVEAAEAAAQLACQVYMQCNNDSDCVLPQGTTRVIQQGLVVEKLAFISWAYRNGEWRTGLGAVDMFLNGANPKGNLRRSTFWAPGKRQYAQSWN